MKSCTRTKSANHDLPFPSQRKTDQALHRPVRSKKVELTPLRMCAAVHILPPTLSRMRSSSRMASALSMGGGMMSYSVVRAKDVWAGTVVKRTDPGLRQ